MHIFQIGAGSGGMAVLDLVARDPRVNRITLVEPDFYSLHNVHRHLFPPAAVGCMKADLAAEWIRAIRPDIVFESLIADVTDPARQTDYTRVAAECDIGICAADNESAKFAFDALMRVAGKPWTLGEVLSGGIGGWVHHFVPGGPCYGCVASYLQREVAEQPTGPPPDYRDPTAAQPEMTLPASKASIAVIAGLHATLTLEESRREAPTSLLFSLQVVPGVFDVAYRAHRLRIARSSTCLTCGVATVAPTGEALDAAVDDALARLGAR